MYSGANPCIALKAINNILNIITGVTCRDCTENKQPEAETSLVYDVLIRVIKKESASSTSVEKKKRNKTCEACEVKRCFTVYL